LLTISHRAANDLDLKQLTHARGTFGRNVVTVSLPVGVVVFGIVYFSWRSALVASVIAAILFLASLLSNIRFFRKVKQRELLKADDKAVAVFAVSSDRVLDIEPLGDDSPAFCFFVGEGKALLLVGQWLLNYDSFPTKSLQIHCWADTKEPIRIETNGQSIEPEQSKIKLRPTHRFGKIELIDATPETLQTDLDRTLMHKVGIE
jgi:hypothetical protein